MIGVCKMKIPFTEMWIIIMGIAVFIQVASYQFYEWWLFPLAQLLWKIVFGALLLTLIWKIENFKTRFN
jgi:hypothetical protein